MASGVYARTKEWKERNIASQKGKHHSPNTEFKKGNPSWNKGKVWDEMRGENNPKWKGGPKLRPSNNHNLICKWCGKGFKGRKGYLYCSDKCVRDMRSDHRKRYFQEHKEEIREQMGTRVTHRNKKDTRKQYYVDKKGGKCSACVRIYPLECYDFHHIDPTTKKNKKLGEDSSRSVSLMAMRDEEIEVEIEKTILLCANCHRIVHAKLRDRDNDTSAR